MAGLFVVNTHPLERALRVLVGVGLVSLVFFGPKTAWGYIGLIPIATGLSGMCPLYSILGFSTCRVSLKK